MPKIDNIELSQSEVEMAESMGLDEYINYDEPKHCEQCGQEMSDIDALLNAVCLKCCKKNHKAVAKC